MTSTSRWRLFAAGVLTLVAVASALGYFGARESEKQARLAAEAKGYREGKKAGEREGRAEGHKDGRAAQASPSPASGAPATGGAGDAPPAATATPGESPGETAARDYEAWEEQGNRSIDPGEGAVSSPAPECQKPEPPLACY